MGRRHRQHDVTSGFVAGFLAEDAMREPASRGNRTTTATTRSFKGVNQSTGDRQGRIDTPGGNARSLNVLLRGGRARADSAHTKAADPASPRAAQPQRRWRRRLDREERFF